MNGDGEPVPAVTHAQESCRDRQFCLCVGFCFQAYLTRPECRDWAPDSDTGRPAADPGGSNR